MVCVSVSQLGCTEDQKGMCMPEWGGEEEEREEEEQEEDYRQCLSIGVAPCRPMEVLVRLSMYVQEYVRACVRMCESVCMYIRM